jgi:predicted metal-dependent hydrolase
VNDYEVLEAADCDQRAGFHPRYLAFVSVFNSGLYFEAHEVLEPLWLSCRGQTDAPFYKGLIQLAGAFVHATRGRATPAASLFKLARKNLKAFAPIHQELNVASALGLISDWLARLESPPAQCEPINLLPPESRRLLLISASPSIVTSV